MPRDSALLDLGYTAYWQALFAPYAAQGLTPARVVRSARGSAIVATESGVLRAKPAAGLMKSSGGAARLPAVGDWVAVLTDEDLEVPLVEAVLKRSSAIVRGDPGETGVQVLAANIDIVFVVHPIADEPNVRRIERELSLAWDSDAVPVVVLTKSDLSSAPEKALAEVEAVAPGTDIHVTSGLTGVGVAPLLSYVAGRRTAVLIGPSGAGKSTLINSLLGEQRQATRAVRVSDGRGRHTTIARELVQMVNGGLIVDTPGLRALALTGSEEGIAAAFPDIMEAAERCRFRDCAHGGEPGCAVRAAVASSDLSAERLESYLKLVREARVAAAKSDPRLRAAEPRRGKTIDNAASEFHRRTGWD
ncbi:MAG TPA: ribosome small subunit-dependent GTPase A [Thermoleophilia bacterium]|nr:ribosome small subunit-dependent GTPase A [Thermoleophilia bacterium]